MNWDLMKFLDSHLESSFFSLPLIPSSRRENGGETFEKQAYFWLKEEQTLLTCGLTQDSLRTPHPPGLLYFVRLSPFLFHIDLKFEKLNLFSQ